MPGPIVIARNKVPARARTRDRLDLSRQVELGTGSPRLSERWKSLRVGVVAQKEHDTSASSGNQLLAQRREHWFPERVRCAGIADQVQTGLDPFGRDSRNWRSVGDGWATTPEANQPRP